LLAGARFAMIMLQICHPKFDMSNTVERCHAKVKKRRRNVDKINDNVTPIAEEMIADLLRMDTEFFSDGHYVDAPEGQRVQIYDLI
jgi:hypothetical protein